MKVSFHLNCFGIDTSQKEQIDIQGNILKTLTLESILSFMTIRYYYNEYETIHIHSDHFRKISSNYRLYLNYMKEKGLILINEFYKKGKLAKGYMFTDYFKAFAVIRKVDFDRRDRLEEREQKIQFDIDLLVEKKIAQDFDSIQIKQLNISKEIKFYTEDNFPIVNFRKYLSDEVNLLRLREKAFSFKLHACRFFTPFTFLSKDVRENHIYFDEFKLVNLDIKNSFPLWLSVWLIEKEITIDYDTREFMNEILSGNFYSSLIHKFNESKDLFNNTEFERPHMTKADVKVQFMEWLNGDSERMNLTNYVFRAYYPSIFEFLKTYKAGKKDVMYYELVKMESAFILNTICKRIYSEIPDIKILTCHDQIYFSERYLTLVKPIWDEEINKVRSQIPVHQDIDFDNDDLMDLGIEITFF